MKGTRLSLAALVAIGALSHANAATLEETIGATGLSLFDKTKIDGFGRLKANVKDKDSADNTIEDLRLSGQINVVAPASDELFFGVSVSADGHNNAAKNASAPIGSYNDANNKGVYVDRFFFRYDANDIRATIGKQDIFSPWTETGFNASRGNGVVALYTGVQDWTFAAAGYLQTNGLDDTNAHKIPGANQGELDSSHNLYAIGATGDLKDIGLGVKVYAGLYEHIIDTAIYTDVQYQVAGFKIRGQLNYAKLDKDFAVFQGLSDDAGLYYGLELSYKYDIFSVLASYLKTDKDQPIFALDGDNDGFIKQGSDLYYYSTNVADTAGYYLKGGVNIGKWDFTLGYGILDSGSKGYDATLKELACNILYRYNKNFRADLSLATFDGDDAVSDYNSATLQLIYRF